MIVPLLLCVLLLNYMMIEFLEESRITLQDLKKTFEDFVSGYYYYTDPVSGNYYPMTANSTPPSLG
ncbi:MAG: hypothetical protein H5T34_08145 [Candidatus Methanomethyliales bacterium]|nr:hypothetical protein [Candidatus Methanomethylicales archaeon]